MNILSLINPEAFVAIAIILVVYCILRFYRSKRREFEDNLYVGQYVQLVDEETERIISTWIVDIDHNKKIVKTGLGDFNFKKLLS